mmetsp:Transcript_44352/g.87598  ORF Transcript_44352/g.87598 Transcript_44352/m.87598 type:complete len:244 (+) Transcript_44352:1031-1762(+)
MSFVSDSERAKRRRTKQKEETPSRETERKSVSQDPPSLPCLSLFSLDFLLIICEMLKSRRVGSCLLQEGIYLCIIQIRCLPTPPLKVNLLPVIIPRRGGRGPVSPLVLHLPRNRRNHTGNCEKVKEQLLLLVRVPSCDLPNSILAPISPPRVLNQPVRLRLPALLNVHPPPDNFHCLQCVVSTDWVHNSMGRLSRCVHAALIHQEIVIYDQHRNGRPICQDVSHHWLGSRDDTKARELQRLFI